MTNTIWSHFYVESEVVDIIETGRMVVDRNGAKENGAIFRGQNFSYSKQISSGDLTSTVGVAHSTVLYSQASLTNKDTF